MDELQIGTETEVFNESSPGVIIPEPTIVTLQESDLGASKPVLQVQYKQQPTQHPTVVSCGHTLDTRHFPTHANCQDCWDGFFETNIEALTEVHQLLLTRGTQAVLAVHGAKFTKALGKYLRKQLLKMHQQTQTEPSIVAPSLTEMAQGD